MPTTTPDDGYCAVNDIGKNVCDLMELNRAMEKKIENLESELASVHEKLDYITLLLHEIIASPLRHSPANVQ
jgi:hypothetical protein